jgi:6-phosphogluconolactonase
MEPSNVQVKTFASLEELIAAAAQNFRQAALEAVASRGQFLVALSGGSTPRTLFRLLAGTPFKDDLPWPKMHFFWGDERCVPPTDAESNYHLAVENWLRYVNVLPENLHRVKGELPPEEAAADYARQLKEFAPADATWPRLDWALMGLGADGHTASLFPGSPVENPSGAAVIAVTASYEGRPANRVTLTPQVFNDARRVVFLATGEEKAKAVAATLEGQRDPLLWPAQRIQPQAGEIFWFVDQAAAGLLSK